MTFAPRRRRAGVAGVFRVPGTGDDGMEGAAMVFFLRTAAFLVSYSNNLIPPIKSLDRMAVQLRSLKPRLDINVWEWTRG